MPSSQNTKAPLPQILYLEVTNRCNLKCRTCIQFRGMKEEPRDLSWEEIEEIVDQIAELKRVVLHGIGEPLLNRELVKIIRSLKERGVYVLFNSNATLLSPDWAEGLIACGLDEFRVSLDAATEYTYARIRDSETFFKVVNNIETLLQKRKAGNRSNPRVSAWMVGTRENVADLPELIVLASRIGIDEVYLQRLVHPVDGPGRGLARREKAISRPSNEIAGILRKSRVLSRQLRVPLMASGMVSPSESLRSKPKETAPWQSCKRPWEVTYITAWANVLPCCIAPFSTWDYESLIQGNLFEQTIDQVWMGEKYREFRRKLQSSDPPGCCIGCGVEWSL